MRTRRGKSVGTMNKKSLKLITLGCSKNTVDSERLLAGVSGCYEILPENSRKRADFLLINTCGFIGDAKEQSVNTILEAAKGKKQGRAGKLVVFGCLSERYSKDLPSLIPEVDKWFGVRDFSPLLSFMRAESGIGNGSESGEDPGANSCEGNLRGGAAGRQGGKISGLSGFSSTERYREGINLPYAYMKISEGCDRRCSYCAIPLIRGGHHSIPGEALLSEAKFLAERGVKELILIAQDSTYYGLDLYKKRTLASLLEKLSQVEGIKRIRLHYSYPEGFPLDVLDVMADNPKICRYLDLPLQHISDRVLKMMRRSGDSSSIRKLLSTIREKVPGVVLRTTMIVGHPGEEEEDFRGLLDFVAQTRFERLGAFTYSEEEGTYGARHYADAVPWEEKERRYAELMSLQKEISSAYNLSRVGKEETLLADEFVGGTLVCRSEFESPDVDGEIFVKPENEEKGKALAGQFFKARISGASDYDLTAEII